MIYNNSLRKKTTNSINKNYNYKKELLNNKKINQDFLNRIKLLTLEDLIYLKLDSISSSLKGKIMGIPIYKFISDICLEATVKYALSVAKNKRDATAILGIDKTNLNKQIRRFKINLGEKNAQ